MSKLNYIFLLTCCLTACSTEGNYAPVTDIATIEHVPKSGNYRVASGETLYSIAWRYGLDYRYLASLNHIVPPFHVAAGQRIYLRGKPMTAHASSNVLSHPLQQPTVSVRNPSTQPIPSYSASADYVEHDTNTPVASWFWPARGSIVNSYSGVNKGINIGGHIGDPVYATAAGQVVYSGNGLRAYGNLIIVKHNTHYLTAYAYNNAVLVKEGQQIKAGQEIAKMGRLHSSQAMLHFEIRHNGQPVNPLNYLSGRNRSS